MNHKSIRWCFNFQKWNPSKQDLLKATSGIQIEEKERLDKFVFKEDFKSSLIGRLMMRKFVNETLQIPYNEIAFVRDEKGKPILKLPEGIQKNISFNVSHHGKFTVLAGEVGSNIIGTDVMKLEYTGGKTLSEFFRIMTRHFSPTEWATIKGCNTSDEQIAMFCRHWSLKESYVKAVGVGITINLQDISFKINSGHLSQDDLVSNTELYIKNEKQDWVFQEMLIDKEHCVSVALPEGQKYENQLFQELTFQNLTLNLLPLLPEDEAYCERFFKKLEKK